METYIPLFPLKLVAFPGEEINLHMINHLLKVIPILRDVEAAKKKIQMNGHFKNLDPLDF